MCHNLELVSVCVCHVCVCVCVCVMCHKFQVVLWDTYSHAGPPSLVSCQCEAGFRRRFSALGGLVLQGNLEQRKDDADPQSNVFGSLLTTFGSVEVGGRNFFKLMQQGECVLLYPGGVREVTALPFCSCHSNPLSTSPLLLLVSRVSHEAPCPLCECCLCVTG